MTQKALQHSELDIVRFCKREIPIAGCLYPYIFADIYRLILAICNYIAPVVVCYKDIPILLLRAVALLGLLHYLALTQHPFTAYL